MAALVLTTAALSLVEPPLLARQSTVAAACAPHASFAERPTTMGRRALLSSAAAAALVALPAAAPAESTLVTRQASYTRYVPRIERGRDFWQTKLRKDIAAGDWKSIKKELEPVGKKDKGGAMKKVLGPMGLWSSSWSSKVISDKTIAMNAAIDELAEVGDASTSCAAMPRAQATCTHPLHMSAHTDRPVALSRAQAIAALEIAANGEEKDSGIFGFLGAKKSLDPAQRQQLAAAAYKKGVRAFNKYIEIGNDGLGLNFAPLDTID